MKLRMLSERQVRWAALLSRFNMEILYRPGKENVRADALSRREQDLPADAEDDRLQKRIIQILKPTTSCYEEAAEEDPTATWVISARVRAGPAVVREQATKEQLEVQEQDVPISELTSAYRLENLW
jgi:hypothetical protein